MSDDLTRYNPLLCGATKALSVIRDSGAINCTSDLFGCAEKYIRASVSENTRAAYVSDLKRFEEWGGQIPASPETVSSYLASQADVLSVATLVRRLAAIAKAHRSRGLIPPTTSELVKATMRGVRKVKGSAQLEAKPLVKAELILVLEAMGTSLKHSRDRALLLLGFAGGFRRSELVSLDVRDIESVRQGLIVHLRRSKVDQSGFGRKIGIPLGRTKICPVAALTDWLVRSEISEGALFRPINRHGQIIPQRLSGEAVSSVVKESVTSAGINPVGYSGHSLRAGLATSAAQAGVSAWKIRQQTGHASDAMLGRYIRDSELFSNNAAGTLF